MLHGFVSLDTVSFLFTGLNDRSGPRLDIAEAQNLERCKAKHDDKNCSYEHSTQVKTDGRSYSN